MILVDSDVPMSLLAAGPPAQGGRTATSGGVVDEVLPIERRDAELACDTLLARWGLSARDAIHVAVMRHHEIERIFSFDRGFDGVSGVSRVH